MKPYSLKEVDANGRDWEPDGIECMFSRLRLTVEALEQAEASATRGWEMADSLHISVAEQRTRAEKAEAELLSIREEYECLRVGGIGLRADNERLRAESENERLRGQVTELVRIVYYARCTECGKRLGAENDCIEAHHVEAREAIKETTR